MQSAVELSHLDLMASFYFKSEISRLIKFKSDRFDYFLGPLIGDVFWDLFWLFIQVQIFWIIYFPNFINTSRILLKFLFIELYFLSNFIILNFLVIDNITQLINFYLSLIL